MTKLLAIDPGPEQSAVLLYDTHTRLPLRWEKTENWTVWCSWAWTADQMAIEKIASYGMAVGEEVFETAVWSGRFIERWCMTGNRPPIRVTRKECALHVCNSPRASDSNVRQALIDRYGPGSEKAIGRKAAQGPLYGISGDCWAALAVAITAAETRLGGVAA